MKEPEQWFAIVRALGMFLIIIVFFILLMTVYIYRSATPTGRTNGSTTAAMTTPNTSPIATSLPTHQTSSSEWIPGRETGMGGLETQMRLESLVRFFFFLLIY